MKVIELLSGITDLLTLLCVICAFGFAALVVIVGSLFRKHDRDVLASLDRLNKLVKERL